VPDPASSAVGRAEVGRAVLRSDGGVGQTVPAKGQIYFASIDDRVQNGSAKAIFRMPQLDPGLLRAGAARRMRAVLEELKDSTRGVEEGHAPARRPACCLSDKLRR